MRISDWSSDVCSSDLVFRQECLQSAVERNLVLRGVEPVRFALHRHPDRCVAGLLQRLLHGPRLPERRALVLLAVGQEHRNPDVGGACRSEEHTSELQSLMRISYAVFCLKKKTNTTNTT